MPKDKSQRKPHLLKVKRDIVALVDKEIENAKRLLPVSEHLSQGDKNIELRREIAIWIKERNRLAKAADLEETPLKTKSNQGVLIWDEDNEQ